MTPPCSLCLGSPSPCLKPHSLPTPQPSLSRLDPAPGPVLGTTTSPQGGPPGGGGGWGLQEQLTGPFPAGNQGTMQPRLLPSCCLPGTPGLAGKQPVGTGLGVGRGWLGKWLGIPRPQWGG